MEDTQQFSGAFQWTQVPCEDCRGQGAFTMGFQRYPCPTCQGRGTIRKLVALTVQERRKLDR